MSRELNPLHSGRNEDVQVASYWGGNGRGTALQLTQFNQRTRNHESVQLTREQALQMQSQLNEWLEETR